VLAEHAKTVARLSTTGSDRRLYHLRDVAAEWVEETRNDAQGGGRRLGWPTLDAALTTPIRRSEVISVAARASVGKTYALVDVAAHMIETGPGVALFNSLEMPRTDIFERVAGQALDQRSDELRAAALTDDAIWPMIEDARPDLDRFRIDDRPSSIHNLSQICASARRDGLDPAIVCIDYLGLLRWEGAKGAPLYERVSETARAIKDFAKSENVVVLMAVQLNRSAGAGERPTMEMLRDSGAIEEVSDRIIALYAPERDPKCTDAERIAYRNLVRAFFLKNRKGPLGDEAQLIYTPGRRLREIADD
jgi:replicative DNA helicase